MNKLGLKLWSTNTEFYLNEAKKLFDKCYFDYIELYIVPNTLNNLSNWKKLKIPYIIHAPHFAHKMNLSKAECFDNNMNLYNQVKIYADELKTEHIIFHGGTDGSYLETANQLKFINDKRSLIENKPFKTVIHIKGDYYIGSKIEEILSCMKTSNCGFCLDIGHAMAAANSFNIDPYEYIKLLLQLKPMMYHLSDTDIKSEIDLHYNFGQGNLNMEKLFEILPSSSIITIETNKSAKENLDDFVEDIKYLRKFLI